MDAGDALNRLGDLARAIVARHAGDAQFRDGGIGERDFPICHLLQILSGRAVLSNRAGKLCAEDSGWACVAEWRWQNARIESRRSSLIPQSEAAWVLFVLAVAWFAVCFRLGDLPLEQPDEGRNAEVAREMKAAGAWLVPTYDGIAYLDKPAFYFKAVALSLAMFGDSETAARMPSAVFGLGAGVDLYFLPARIWRPLRRPRRHRAGDHAAFSGECADGDL